MLTLLLLGLSAVHGVCVAQMMAPMDEVMVHAADHNESASHCCGVRTPPRLLAVAGPAVDLDEDPAEVPAPLPFAGPPAATGAPPDESPPASESPSPGSSVYAVTRRLRL